MRSAVFQRLDSLDYSGNEALNTICSNITFAGRDVKKVVVTSCSPSDGKSFMSVQIAQNLARRGKRVVLVDGDLRRSNLISRYGIVTTGEMTGLVHYLAGYCSIDDALYQTNIDNFYMIPIGREVANPIPLLDSPFFSELLNYLAMHFDLVLVDAPPVGLVIDAAEIAGNCDGVVFVVKYNETRRRDIVSAKRQMDQTGCPILGCVINEVTFDSLSAKKYYNKSYYSHYGKYYRQSDQGGEES